MALSNDLNISQEGVVYFNGVAQFSGVDGSTIGKVLTSNGTGVAPSFQTSGSVTTLTGDSGSATGSNITLYSNNAANNSGATVKFVNSGSTSTLNVSDLTLFNTFLGKNSGKLTVSGGSNSGFGYGSLSAVTSGERNTAIGTSSMLVIQTGQANTAIGNQSLTTNVSGLSNTAIGNQALSSSTGSYNCAVGVSSLSLYTGDGACAVGYLSCRDTTGVGNAGFGYITLVNCSSGQSNTAIGNGSLQNMVSGSDNTCLGYNSGFNYTTNDSNNICIGPSVYGTTGESNVIRIGNGSTKAFVAGISGITVAASVAVLIDANGQMGTILSSERYKENIVDMPESISVLNLRPIQFNYKPEHSPLSTPEIQYGLLAEDIAKDFPYLAVYKDGQPETVKYHELCVFLLAEIQRLEKRISILEVK
jgi:hypothetical protein